MTNLTDLIYLENVTRKEALAKAKELNGRILLEREVDHLAMQGILRDGWYWTGTHIEYAGTKCKVTENGKTVERSIPEKDGWYEKDEFCLPFGKPSSADNPEARHLWRSKKNSGLVARGYDRWDDWGRRYVGCDYGPDYRLGVFILQNQNAVGAGAPSVSHKARQ